MVDIEQLTIVRQNQYTGKLPDIKMTCRLNLALLQSVFLLARCNCLQVYFNICSLFVEFDVFVMTYCVVTAGS